MTFDHPDPEAADILARMEARILERDRERVALAAKAPLRSKGRAVEDAAHLPLFVAASEPSLF